MASRTDPFSHRMIFLKVGRMECYQGLTRGDTITGGGSYVAEHEFGHEIFNFQPHRGGVFGYVQPPPRHERWYEARIDLAHLGASSEDESIPGVLAVWVANLPGRGAFVVGWYQNATVYRTCQPSPPGSRRRHRGIDCGYYVTAKAGDAVLLAGDERVFFVPKQVKGGFGQSNVWYAENRELNRQFRLDLLEYIRTRRVKSSPRGSGSAAPRQSDLLLRQQVERVAMKVTADHFGRLGYEVTDVSAEKRRWDLEAAQGKRELKLEVKGLSGSQVVVELTPREYAAMQEYRDDYRLCVVTNALAEPRLQVFAHLPDSGQWVSAGGTTLHVQRIIAARCSAP